MCVCEYDIYIYIYICVCVMYIYIYIIYICVCVCLARITSGVPIREKAHGDLSWSAVITGDLVNNEWVPT